MSSSKPSWAAIASKAISSESPSLSASIKPPSPSAIQPSQPPRTQVAFISGHIDITPTQFEEHYATALDAAIRRGDEFVLSNAGGVDTLALAYLRSQSVHPSRITVFLHTPRPNRNLNATQIGINKTRLGPEAEEKLKKEGYNTRVINGYHTERDAAMTEDSDYDILWIRGAMETVALYGAKYRPGRVSGTQKNRDRRTLKNSKAGLQNVT